jgi:hypothetical protein
MAGLFTLFVDMKNDDKTGLLSATTKQQTLSAIGYLTRSSYLGGGKNAHSIYSICKEQGKTYGKLVLQGSEVISPSPPRDARAIFFVAFYAACAVFFSSLFYTACAGTRIELGGCEQ